MTRVLVIAASSQTGQLSRVVDRVVAPLEAAEGVTVTRLTLQPARPFPFPWPFLRFFNTFPETVYEEPIALKPLNGLAGRDFDLVILAYQVWFLSPSLPMSTFLNSPEAETLLRDKPVMTLIACRNMWLQAQEKVKAHLARLGARHIDNAVLTDRAHSAATFVSTPLWMLTGRRGPFLGGRIPAAGIPEDDIRAAGCLGEAIVRQLPDWNPQQPHSLWRGQGAVTVNERLIASEKIAHRSFRIWGRLLRSLGGPDSRFRKAVLCLYIAFLVLMILTVVPLTAIIKRLLTPLTRGRVARQRAYFAAPSGEDDSLRKAP